MYISSLQKNTIPYEEELLTPVQQLNEYIMTALRTMEGIDLGYVAENFGKDNARKLDTAGKKWEVAQTLISEDQKMVLTKKGKLFADGIAADLFF